MAEAALLALSKVSLGKMQAELLLSVVCLGGAVGYQVVEGLVCVSGKIIGKIVEYLTLSEEDKISATRLCELRREAMIRGIIRKFGCSQAVAEYIYDNRRLPSKEEIIAMEENEEWLFVNASS